MPGAFHVCLIKVYKTDWPFIWTHDLCMIKEMASLKLYIIINVTSFVLALLHYRKYFQFPVWQDFIVVDSEGKKEVSYSGDSTRTIFLSKQKWINVEGRFFLLNLNEVFKGIVWMQSSVFIFHIPSIKLPALRFRQLCDHEMLFLRHPLSMCSNQK